jgi:hypothetical protein
MKKLVFSIIAISCLVSAKSMSSVDEQIKNIKIEQEQNKLEVSKLLSKKDENMKRLELFHQEQTRALLLHEERKRIRKEQEAREFSVKQNLENKLALAKSELETKKNKFKEDMQARMDKDENYSDKKRIQNQEDEHHQLNVQARQIQNESEKTMLEKQSQYMDLDLERKSIATQGIKENQSIDIENRQLETQVKKAQVDRAGDYVSADLERKRADNLSSTTNQELDLERKRAEIDFKKAQASRANDYITQDINQRKAENDVIQSGADAIRNISEGDKNLLTGIGRGAEKSSSK